MGKKRVSLITTVSIVIVFLLTVFAAAATPGNMSLISNYVDFVRQARFATDVVIAEFVAQESDWQFEFVVHERILGDAPERISVYHFEFIGELRPNFVTDTRYLLILREIHDLHNDFFDDGFRILTRYASDLNDLPLGVSRAAMIAHVRGLTLFNDTTPIRDFIRSENLEDIIAGSPYFYEFTSRNSLHNIDQLDEIVALITETQ